MNGKLSGKIAAVTGGASGIGEAMCRRFLAEGARVAILDINAVQGQALAEALDSFGERIRCFETDVTRAERVCAAFDAIGETFGGLDILVNNAGIGHVGSLEKTREEDFDRLYQVNVKGVYLCSQKALPLLRKRGGGVILNMASICATVGIPDRFAYSMTKGAVAMMTKSMALDLINEGIRCVSISPARVHTPFVDAYLAKNYPGEEQAMFETLAATQPIGRMGQPDEVASLAAFLCSDEASFMTGADYPIDGGFNALRP